MNKHDANDDGCIDRLGVSELIGYEQRRMASVPPHVAATDARRAAEMKRVTNAKLGEWSQALSLIIHDLSGLKQPRAEIGRRLEALQSDIVRAMDGKPICPTCHSTGRIEYGEGLSLSIEECPDCLRGGYR